MVRQHGSAVARRVTHPAARWGAFRGLTGDRLRRLAGSSSYGERRRTTLSQPGDGRPAATARALALAWPPCRVSPPGDGIARGGIQLLWRINPARRPRSGWIPWKEMRGGRLSRSSIRRRLGVSPGAAQRLQEGRAVLIHDHEGASSAVVGPREFCIGPSALSSSFKTRRLRCSKATRRLAPSRGGHRPAGGEQRSREASTLCEERLRFRGCSVPEASPSWSNDHRASGATSSSTKLTGNGSTDRRAWPCSSAGPRACSSRTGRSS